MENVLITGGAGYIGSILARILLQRGFRVRVVDNLLFGGESIIELLNDERFEFLEVNPLAGLNPIHSDLPIICGRIGMSYRDLIGEILASAAVRSEAGKERLRSCA